MKLISIHLPSNKPFHFRRLLENLLSTAFDPLCFEVVVKIDLGDLAMLEAIARIKSELTINLKVIVSEPFNGYFNTYIAYNELLSASDPEYYFCWHIPDEVLIETNHWDQKLTRYIGYFQDDVFRLKVDPKKMFRNLFEIYDICLYADCSIVPRKWLDASGKWGECHGPDTYQEGVSFYLSQYGYHRDIPLLDIVVGGDAPGENLTPEKTLQRLEGTPKAWDFSLTANMQEKMARTARRLQLFIMAYELGLENWELRDELDQRSVILVAKEHVYARVFYGLDYVGITLSNFKYVAKRVWPYSLSTKKTSYKFVTYTYLYFIYYPLKFLTTLAKIIIGLMFGFSLKALIAGAIENDSMFAYLMKKLR
jgi:hypothetical protein